MGDVRRNNYTKYIVLLVEPFYCFSSIEETTGDLLEDDEETDSIDSMLLIRKGTCILAKKLEDLNLVAMECALETRRDELRNVREVSGKKNKSIEEQTLNAYLNQDYWLAFHGAYRLLLFPIIVEAKRLYRKKFRHKKPEQYNYQLESCVEKVYFLSETTKKAILEDIKFTIQLNNKEKEFEWSIRKIRNETVHNENYWSEYLTEQFDYQRMTLHLIDLANCIRKEQQGYQPKNKKQKRRHPRALARTRRLLKEA